MAPTWAAGFHPRRKLSGKIGGMNSIADLELLAVGPFVPEQVGVVWHEAQAAARGPEGEAFLAERWGGAVAEARVAGRELFNAPITQLL